MSEKIPSPIEVAAEERVSTPEEVHDLFEQFAAGETLKETRRREDEKGLYLWEMEIDGPAPGEVVEFSYMRKGRYKEGEAAISTIQATYFVDGMPISGKTVADLVDDKWVLR